MNRKLPFSACLVLMFLAALLTFQIVKVQDQIKYNKIVKEFTVKPLENPKLSEIEALVDEHYVKDIDNDKLTEAVAMGYVYGLGDQHAGYYTADIYRELQLSIYGELVGIGIRVTLEQIDDAGTERVVIFEVMENTPASEAGLEPGDVIYSVDGSLYTDLGYDETVDRMLGKEGTVLNFEVLRDDEILEFSITRRHFDSQLVTYKMTDADEKIGYVRIYQFGYTTVNQFKNAVNSLIADGAEKLIFDVRNNPGGEYDTIKQILDFLLPEGKIVITRDKNGNEIIETSDASEIALPMVVLANNSSASAAELFTAALMDHNKAYFIGTTTYGKGTIQTTFPLSDGSAVKFSTQYYLPPSGESYDGVGIVPDMEVKLSEEAEKHFYLIDESEDAQLCAAIKYLQNEK
ncbi:MAG: S41 family peptidase [Ruminococcaceae bacterium]|nr:S41 family peptidase [Oscillospiraceae bacterium]